MTENYNPNGSLTVKIDRTLMEQKLMDEKEAERKAKESAQKQNEALEAELTAYKEKEEAQKLADEQKATERANRKPANGSVPINPPQNFDSRRAYNSLQDCYADVSARAATGDNESKKIMDAWLSNLVTANKNGESLGAAGKLSSYMGDKSLASLYNENLRRRLKIQGVI